MSRSNLGFYSQSRLSIRRFTRRLPLARMKGPSSNSLHAAVNMCHSLAQNNPSTTWQMSRAASMGCPCVGLCNLFSHAASQFLHDPMPRDLGCERPSWRVTEITQSLLVFDNRNSSTTDAKCVCESIGKRRKHAADVYQSDRDAHDFNI